MCPDMFVGLLADSVLTLPHAMLGEPAEGGLNRAGVIIMTLSIGSILTLVVYCYRRVLGSPNSQEDGPDHT